MVHGRWVGPYGASKRQGTVTPTPIGQNCVNLRSDWSEFGHVMPVLSSDWLGLSSEFSLSV